MARQGYEMDFSRVCEFRIRELYKINRSSSHLRAEGEKHKFSCIFGYEVFQSVGVKGENMYIFKFNEPQRPNNQILMNFMRYSQWMSRQWHVVYVFYKNYVEKAQEK